MKALCAVDGSKFSMRAIEALITLFHASLREVILLHVMDTSLVNLGLKKEETEADKTNQILTKLETEGRRILKTSQAHATRVLRDRKAKSLVTFRPVLAKGHPAYTLVKQAEKRKPHIIIVGSRGFHDIKDYVMGSVSRKVLSHAPCPVLIVKDPMQAPVQVVLAVDGSNASRQAADYLLSWIPPNVVSIHVISVIPQVTLGISSNPYSDALEDAFQNQAKKTATQIRSLFAKRKFQVTSEVVPGNPRAAILECLLNREPNLAVLGAKGLTGPERFQIGSVSEWVAAHAGCSTLVVRPQQT